MNSVQVSPHSLRSSSPRNNFCGTKTTWWPSTALVTCPRKPQNVIQPFPCGCEGEMQGGWFASADNAQDVIWKQKLTCESQHGAKQAGNPGLPQPTTGAAAALCCTTLSSTADGREGIVWLPWVWAASQSASLCHSLSGCTISTALAGGGLVNRALGHCLVMSWHMLQSPVFWTNTLFFSSFWRVKK